MPNILKEKLITPEAIDALKGLYQNSTLGKQNFGPNDSAIGSAVNHPGDAIQKAIKWLEDNMHLAAGMPQQNQDEGSMYAYAPSGEQQAQAGINLAGMAELGSMPGAPMSAGGTLGTTSLRNGDNYQQGAMNLQPSSSSTNMLEPTPGWNQGGNPQVMQRMDPEAFSRLYGNNPLVNKLRR